MKPKPDPDNLLQWIYNDADIDASPVVGARGVGVEANQALLNYFHGRKIRRVDLRTSIQPN